MPRISADGADSLLAHDTLGKSAQSVRLQKEKGATYSDPHLPNKDSQSTFGITVHIKLRPSGKLKRVVYSLFYKGLLPFSHFAGDLVGNGKCLTAI